MKADLLRFGLIGAGAIAQSYVALFHKLRGARVVGVADPQADRARTVAEALDCRAFGSHDELMGEVDCDAAVICTPPATHAEVGLDLVERGIPVLCEKPLTLDLASARKLVDAAGNAGVPLTMAAKFRYVDDAARAKSIVDSGDLGEVVLFDNIFASHTPMAGRWNADPAVSGGGVLMDHGTHSVDIARYFLGSIADVMAVAPRRVQEVPVEDTAQMFIRSVDGVCGTIDLSWSIDMQADRYISIYGSEGTVNVGWRESKWRPASGANWIKFGNGYNKIQAMSAQVDNFCGAVQGREELLITAEEAVASVAVIEAAYASLDTNAWVPVNGAASSA
jgi:predicted dehydrogenase